MTPSAGFRKPLGKSAEGAWSSRLSTAQISAGGFRALCLGRRTASHAFGMAWEVLQLILSNLRITTRAISVCC